MSGLPFPNDPHVIPPDRTLLPIQTVKYGMNVVTWPEYKEIDLAGNVVYPAKPTTGSLTLNDVQP